VVRLTFKYDGNQVAQGQIVRTVPIRFSLDETLDVGEDAGTPIVEDYVDKMPYRFPGALKKFVVVLETANADRGRATTATARGSTGGRRDSMRIPPPYAGLKREYWRNLAISPKPFWFATISATSKSTIRSAPAKSRARSGFQSMDARPVS
jgi:hypothetical protein